VDAGRARAEAHDAALVAGLLGDPGNSTTVLSPIDGTGTITIVVARDGRGALVGNGLAIPHGRVFELWAFRGEIPVPMTVFRPTDGRAIVAFTLGAVDPNQVRGFAITVERGRVETPTLPAAYSGTVTA
jgi:hypothetical protein